MHREKFNFTSDFQDAILACLIRFPEEFYGFGQIIKPEYFTGPSAIEVVIRLQEFHKKYGAYPNFTTLANYAHSRMARANADLALEIVDYVHKLAHIDTADKPAILELAVSFAKERAVYDGLRKIYAAQSEGKGDTVNALEIMEQAMAVGTNYADLGLSLYNHSDEVIDQVSSRTYGIATGYSLLDQVWRTGWAPGWLIVLLAPPKRFKTSWAINLALNIVTTQDVDVLYYACEISQELAALRALTNLTGWTGDDIIDQPEKAKLAAKRALSLKLLGNIWFKGFPSKTASIADIEANAREVIRIYGLKPKAIVVDFAETVRSETAGKDDSDWRQQADIYTQARAMGSRLGCCVIMPDRCNRETVEQAVPNMKSFQGSFEKAGIVDIAIGLCATEAEYLQKRIRYFIFLNRHGQQYLHFGGTVDPEHTKMTLDRPLSYDPEAEESRPKSNRNRSSSHASREASKDAVSTQER